MNTTKKVAVIGLGSIGRKDDPETGIELWKLS